ncbi:MAG: site-specific integrase [Magnetococcales bacterium]|nr:site-specific integrase [Magnetococcales bacterium]
MLPKGVHIHGNGIRIDFFYKSVRCRETLKLPLTKTNIRYAANLRIAILVEIEKGTFNYREHFPDSPRAVLFGGVQQTRITVEEALTRYLEAIQRTTAPSTWRDYNSAVHYHLIPAFGAVRLQDLTTAQVRAWMGGLSISNKWIYNVLVPLRGMCKDAFADGLIERDPMARIRNLSIQREEPDPFSPEEMRAILAELPDQARNLFQFAFWTGLRTGELIALEWLDIDWKRGVIRVRRNSVRKVIKEPKTAAGKREVVLLPMAVEALENQKEKTFREGKRIFHNPRTGQPWETDAQIRKTAWQHAIKKAGIRYRNPYQTRHTYASLMLSAGESPLWVAQQMGHRDWGLIRQRYGRWIPEEDRTAGRKAARMFGEEVTRKKER